MAAETETETETETFDFPPEINKLLSMITNDSCTNAEKEIFFPDLIGNSSDALDKVRFERLTDKSKVDAEPELFIRIVPDKSSNTLTIIDNGIGMIKSDLVNLGTVATSGIKRLMDFLTDDTSVYSCLFWQEPIDFGFYRAYFVAERVVVTTKHDDDEQYVWESQADGSFTVARDTFGENLGRGTKVTLYLKDDQSEYLEENHLKDLVKTYAKFISYQIFLKTTEKDPSGCEWLVINKKPIWMQKPEEINKEEYAAYYKSLMNDGEEVLLAVKHFSVVEGHPEFKAILFVPRRGYGCAPMNLKNVKLYRELIPDYLSFVKGIVDSEDVPLNISREMLQQNGILEVIRENLVKKCFELFFEIAENKEEYNKFYKTFGNNLKLGIRGDSQNRTKIAKLVRYHSTKSGDELTSLKDYVTRMKEGQSEIYYIIGESKTAVESSPFLEKLEKKGYEVLFMVDAIDEYVVGQLKEFEGKKLEGLKLAIKESEDEKVDRVVNSPPPKGYYGITLTEEQKKQCQEWAKQEPEIITPGKGADLDGFDTEEDDGWHFHVFLPSTLMNLSDFYDDKLSDFDDDELTCKWAECKWAELGESGDVVEIGG